MTKKSSKNDTRTYKVRVALTHAHYILVDAKTENEAYKMASKYVKDVDNDEFCLEQATHINTTIEVEEA